MENKDDSNHMKYCLVNRPKDVRNLKNISITGRYLSYREYFEEYRDIYKALHGSDLIKNCQVYTKIVEFICLFAIRIDPEKCSNPKCDQNYGYEYIAKNASKTTLSIIY